MASIKFFCLLLACALVFPQACFAGVAKNVKILRIDFPSPDIKVFFKARDGKKNIKFSVVLTKKDPDAFTKLKTILQKMTLKNKARLDLNIISFSTVGGGALYNSLRLTKAELKK